MSLLSVRLMFACEQPAVACLLSFVTAALTTSSQSARSMRVGEALISAPSPERSLCLPQCNKQ